MTEGRVIGISRGWKSINLLIETPDGNQEVPLSLDKKELKSDYELIPYHMALFGERVRFESRHDILSNCGSTGYTRHENSSTLRILSGKLKGFEYGHIDMG